MCGDLHCNIDGSDLFITCGEVLCVSVFWKQN